MSKAPDKCSISYHENFYLHNDLILSSRTDSGENQLVKRIWDRDHTVWKDDPREIANRLGWLDSPESMKERINEINEFTRQVLEEGVSNIIVLGMGGSSLSCELFSNLFTSNPGYPDLDIVDTTHPDTILRIRNSIELKKTVVIVSTKSGTTVETMSLMKYFYRQFVHDLGEEYAGRHFVGITDPGTELEKISSDLDFRKVFINDPGIGGRFSVISYFGLVPAALTGVDLDELLRCALSASENSKLRDTVSEDGNKAARLGIAIGTLAKKGINKMHIVTSEQLFSFNHWLEQLIAESTGKEGVSVLPVVEKSVKDDFNYENGSFFLFTGFDDDRSIDSEIKSVSEKNIPFISLRISDEYAAGGLFFLWEFSVSVIGAVMGINPFDQPNVEDSKVRARDLVEKYKREGVLDKSVADFDYNGIVFCDRYSFGNLQGFKDWLRALVNKDRTRYLSLQLFLDPDERNRDEAMRIKKTLEEKLHLPVTTGFGPRYLHSTGQLHKGDSGKGIFIQVTSDFINDIDIPDHTAADSSSVTFGVLLSAQSLGDYIALSEKNRDTVRIDLGNSGLQDLFPILDGV